MPQYSLDDLTVFVRVLDSNSFSAAARDLHLSPKTVSKQIARLEQALGTTLFERNTRNLRATDEGRALAERARHALASLQEMQDIAARGNRELSGTIRLTAPATFGRKYVSSAVADFCRLHPNVSFDLRLSDQLVDLYGENFDLAVRIGELADSRLLSRRVATSHRVLVAAPAYLQRHGSPKRPEDLPLHQSLLFAYPGLLFNTWSLRKAKRERKITVSGTMRSDNGDVLRDWCVAGMGIALRENWDVHEELRNGQLVRVLTDWTVAPSPISIVRTRREPVPRRLSSFIAFLADRWRKSLWSTHD